MLSVAHAIIFKLYRIKVHLERFRKKSAGRSATQDEIHSVQETLPAVLTPVFTHVVRDTQEKHFLKHSTCFTGR